MTPLKDTYKHKGLRKVLVKTLREKGIKDESVLEAIGRVPRHFFIQKYTAEKAYEDTALQIDAGQTISQPFTVAYQTELLNIKPGLKVLEIGTGSGYQAAILAEMGAKVITVERQEELYRKTAKFLAEMGYTSVKCLLGDGSVGFPAQAPYDRIIVTAGAPSVPQPLLKQLKKGGTLVIPVGDEKIQKMITVLKISEKEYEKIELDAFKFVPLIGEGAW
ncbi:protein-L-isoaspartate(D-aspartate) O-methyltransferase [Anseongella ginsenosidimutans]|uniref:Protein-L-isoaspartate O-methyltransferase n=1 Tax=Anseongella ginsenosidimutans TaxID=496056 RepID=A0A4R3KSV8_9SPHI|nr:protein-L-isoaspartate(D-aspartate) O-methyltransferase [Anseongella ginsenosidimutans]QEC53420.1 protein-L-isoaspartate(D-aspartate) O-methyltransferase [Anseongella ginsenosidimutans]TCS88308.1 protein-L-isoaspartate(D-aspartate) O-methyltransferase [Anseongella ginsenosidimutans]